MRCLTLADSLLRRGAKTHLVSRHVPSHLREEARDRGHGFDVLQGAQYVKSIDELAHSSWLSATQDTDAQQTIRALSNRHWDWVVVDHYALGARWESIVRRVATNVLVIDDI